jgi:hypothetical protein
MGIITTSLTGAKFLAKYTISLASIPHEPYFLIIFAVAAGIGILFQFKTTKHIE